MSKFCIIWMVISAFMLKQCLCERDEREIRGLFMERNEDAISNRQMFRENSEIRNLKYDPMKQIDLRERRQLHYRAGETRRLNEPERLSNIHYAENRENRLEVPRRSTNRDRNIYEERQTHNLRGRQDRSELFERSENRQMERREDSINRKDRDNTERVERQLNVKFEQRRQETFKTLPRTSRINERISRRQDFNDERQLNKIRNIDNERRRNIFDKRQHSEYILGNSRQRNRVSNDERSDFGRILRLERNDIKQNKLPLMGLNNISMVLQSCFVAVFLLKSMGYEKMAQKYNPLNMIDGRGLIAF